MCGSIREFGFKIPVRTRTREPSADAMSSATFREAEKPAPAGADGQGGEQRYG